MFPVLQNISTNIINIFVIKRYGNLKNTKPWMKIKFHVCNVEATTYTNDRVTVTVQGVTFIWLIHLSKLLR